MKNSLKINDLSVSIENEKKIKNVSLEILPGTISLLYGPNGAGKSSLAKAILNHPEYKITGAISYNKEKILKYATDKIVNKYKIFLSHQAPVEISGISMMQFNLELHNRFNPDNFMASFEFVDHLKKLLVKVGLDESFVDRDFNVGFSGGERKKNELLQMLIMKPKFAILDEIDSGMDSESLKKLQKAVKNFAKTNQCGFLIISHNPTISKNFEFDNIYEMKSGEISCQDRASDNKKDRARVRKKSL